MTYIITSVTDYDKKRKKISLDDGRLIFLLYKGEWLRLGLREGGELSEAGLSDIYEHILKPRIKKRALYYLKSSDKTEREIRRKLRESLYPEELIDYALDFLKSYDFVDDSRYAENFINAKRGRVSKREMLQKLRQKGISAEALESLKESLTDEDEHAAAKKTFEKYVRGRDLSEPKERQRVWRYLASKGSGPDTISELLNDNM